MPHDNEPHAGAAANAAGPATHGDGGGGGRGRPAGQAEQAVAAEQQVAYSCNPC